jgi:hypothetical protein
MSVQLLPPSTALHSLFLLVKCYKQPFLDPAVMMDKFKLKNKAKEPGMVVYACNPRLRRLRQEDGEFEANLGYISRHCFKKKKK